MTKFHTKINNNNNTIIIIIINNTNNFNIHRTQQLSQKIISSIKTISLKFEMASSSTDSDATVINSTPATPSRKRSRIWSYFTKISCKEARCDECGMKIATAGNTTDNKNIM